MDITFVEIFDLKNGDNPYKLFIGKKCAIKLRHSNYARTIFSGDVYVEVKVQPIVAKLSSTVG